MVTIWRLNVAPLRSLGALRCPSGSPGTSLRDIGGSLGLANASLLHHYPSKSRLYGAMLARIVMRALRAAPDDRAQ